MHYFIQRWKPLTIGHLTKESGATWRIVSRGVAHYSERLRLRTRRFKCQTCARTSSLTAG